jgi:leucyl aminopeptidase
MSVSHPLLVSAQDGAGAVPIRFVQAGGVLEGATRRWGALHGFEGKPGQLLVVPDADGEIGQVVVGAGATFDPMSVRGLSARLPGGLYRLEVAAQDAELATLAFLLGAYVFDRYKARPDRTPVRLVAPDGVNVAEISRIAAACALAREMVDTPAADMGPLQIETIAREIAESAGAEIIMTQASPVHPSHQTDFI